MNSGFGQITVPLKQMLCTIVSAWLLIAGTSVMAAGYEGFGITAGGDRGPVVQVTSLADSGPGSLREAVKGGNRRIVFMRPGTIRLKKKLVVTRSNVTVDGWQGGVTVSGAPFVIEDSSDVIVRYIRFRNSKDDNLSILGKCRRIVIDHCSSTGATDGALDITLDYDKPKNRPSHITVSWCLFAGTKKAMLIQGADNVSIHHNLFLKNDMRNPQLHDVKNFDFRNNLVQSWGIYGLRARAETTGNVVFNVFGPGQNPRKSGDNALIIAGKSPGETAATAGPICIAGNLGPPKSDLNRLSTNARYLPVAKVRTWPANEVSALLKKHAGAHPLDAKDKGLISGK